MRKLITILCLLAIVVGGFGLFYRHQIWNYLTKERYSPEREQEDIKTAEALLKEDKPKDALDIIQLYQERFAHKGDIPKKWIDLFMKGSLAAGEPENIYFLYQEYPHSVDGNEEASLIVGDLLIKAGKVNDYNLLRAKWKGKEKQNEAWFVLDADKELVDGDRTAAIKLLNSRSFEGSADIPRLIRLAFLNVEDNPRLSWEYLNEAYQKDPKNALVRSYRARLLEAVDKTALALSEYVAAASLDPQNPAMRDQLAEFYRRHGRYKIALKVWEDALEFQNADTIWIKEWFWGRVTVPVDFKWDTKKVPPGELQPFVDYLLSLGPDQFWDQAKFEILKNGNQYLQTQQSTFWLRLIQDLKDGLEDKAWELIQYNSFNPVSWNPELETMLKRVLAYRKNGSLILSEEATQRSSLDKDAEDHIAKMNAAAAEADPSKPLDTADSSIRAAASKDEEAERHVPGTQASTNHPFYAQLQAAAKAEMAGDKNAVTPALKKLLTGKDAFTACFLAAGWLESALAFNTTKVLPEDSPEWLSYGLTQAIRYNRSTMAALEFATKQKPSPALNMLIGELLIAGGSPDAGLEKLLTLSQQTDDIGFRSAWLTALLYIERQQYDQAVEMINTHPRLAQDIVGKEALARIALLRGNTDEADKLYSELENESWEAKSYLARKAYENKNYKRAKELTEALLLEFPNNALIQKNYQKILEEQAGTATPAGQTPNTNLKDTPAERTPTNTSVPNDK